MLYLLDASALINAHRTWYALNRVPEFWRWLLHHAEAGRVKMPPEIHAEVEDGRDDLAKWVKEPAHKRVLRLDEATDIVKVQAVLDRYGRGLTEAELIQIGQDPFRIAAALGDASRRVVTAEVSKATSQRANRRIPDVCNDCGVVWRTPVELINDLDFTTDWDRP